MKIQLIVIFLIISLSGMAQTTVPSGNYLQQIKNLQNQTDSYSKFNRLGKVYQEVGNYKNAINFYNRALQYKTNIKIQVALAKAYESYGKTYKAIQVWQQIINKDSLHLTAKYRLAKLYAQTNNTSQSLKLLQELEKADPLNPNYPYKIGLYSNEINKKLKAFKRAYQKDTTHIKALKQLVKYHKINKNYSLTDLYLKKGLKITPNNTYFLQQKISSDYRKKKYKQMLKSVQKIDSLHFDPVYTNMNYGLAYIMLKKPEKAEKYLQEAQLLDLTNPTIYYYFGLLEANRMHFKKAKEYYQTSINLKKANVYKEYYQLGVLSKKQNRLKTALKYFTKSYQNNPKNHKALFEIALLNDALKNYKKALKYYQKYTQKFKTKDDFKTSFALQQIKQLKEIIFMNK